MKKTHSDKFLKSHVRTYFQRIGFLFPFHFLVRAATSLFIHFCKTRMSQMSVDLFILKQLYQKIYYGLPWWRSGWESACQCRGHGFEPRPGKIPHAAERLGPWATTTEPAHLEPVLRNKRGHDSERPAHRNEEWPPLTATRESPCTETKTQHSQK